MRRTSFLMISILFAALIIIPSLSLSESDYEEGYGWIYQDGELKITQNNGLEDFINNEDPVTQLPKYQHTVRDVTSVVIGRNVTALAIDHMVGFYAPSKTIIEEGNACFVDDSGWIVNKVTNTLFGAANVKESLYSTVIDNLPSYIEVIGPYAISERKDLIHIDIPSGVKEIQESAFWLCRSLQKIEVPNKLHTLGDHVFSNCESLATIELPIHLTNIGDGAFSLCTNLSSLNISNTLIERINEDCFGACFKLQTLELPESVQRIEFLAFRICYALHTLIINSNDLVIEGKAFSSCDNLNRIVFTKGTPKSFGESLFGEKGKTPDGKSYISDSSDRRGEAIPYPTLYYTAAYAYEWAPNGETEWNGYTIQQISQEELDAILAEARGEEVAEVSNSPAPTTVQQLETTAPEKAEMDASPATSSEMILLAAIGIAAIAVTVVLIARVRKVKR